MIKRSLIVPVRFHRVAYDIFFRSGCLRTRSHFKRSGNPAPPMPRNSLPSRARAAHPNFFVAIALRSAPYSQAPGKDRTPQARVLVRMAVMNFFAPKRRANCDSARSAVTSAKI